MCRHSQLEVSPIDTNFLFVLIDGFGVVGEIALNVKCHIHQNEN